MKLLIPSYDYCNKAIWENILYEGKFKDILISYCYLRKNHKSECIGSIEK